MRVYEMASSQNGAFFLAGEFEKTVQDIWFIHVGDCAVEAADIAKIQRIIAKLD